VISVDLPPLRDRPSDIPLLAHHFLQKYTREFSKRVDTISPEVIQRLLRHGFSGNVRELENLIERAVALAEGSEITLEHLPPGLGDIPSNTGSKDALMDLPEGGVQLDAVIHQLEQHLIQCALERTGGRKKDAASLLGITFRSLRYRLDKIDTGDPKE